MARVLKRRERKNKRTSESAKAYADAVREPPDKEEPLRFDRVASTGSTLLDLNISGGRVRGGGVPGGILAEFYGPEGSGKTSLLAELGTSVQMKGGNVDFNDPERRLDKEYSRIYGMNISEQFSYHIPDTVKQMFKNIRNMSIVPDALNLCANDSIAALSTELEMEEEEGDKMGMKQAKEFSQGLRKHARLIGNPDLIVAFSNQIRQGQQGGEKTPGGKGPGFYASLRVRVAQEEMITVTKEFRGTKIKKTIGIRSACFVKKSTVDDPYRECDIYIIFNYGIDDIRGNLQFIKDMTGDTRYNCIEKNYKSMENARSYIEENSLEQKLREVTIDLWLEIQEKFKTDRKPKVRW